MTAKDINDRHLQYLHAKMKDDEIGLYVKHDETLRKFGSSLLQRKGAQQKKHIRNRLRTIGKFCILFNQSCTEELSLKDIMKGSKYKFGTLI